MDRNDWILIIAGAAVFLGVIMEGWEHWAEYRAKGWSPIIPKLGFAILVIGLFAETYAEIRIGQADMEFRTNANTRIGDLNLEAAKFQKQAAELNREAEQFNAKAEEAKKDNLVLAEALQPRRLGGVISNGQASAIIFGDISHMTRDTFMPGGLDRFAGTSVLVQAVPDWEAEKLAVILVQLLSRFGWDAKLADQSLTSVDPAHINDGVAIYTYRNRWTLEPNAPHPGTPEQRRAVRAGLVLSQYMDAFKIDNTTLWMHQFRDNKWWPPTLAPFAPAFVSPVGTIIVLVGSNPKWQTEELTLSDKNNSVDVTALQRLDANGPWPFGWGQ